MRRIRELGPIEPHPGEVNYGCHRDLECVEKKQYADGGYPYAGVTNVDGTLYGVTFSGGGRNTKACLNGSACGTVFALTNSGKFKVLHRFANEPDGYGPIGRLVDVNGTLYGTTVAGGGGSCRWEYTVTPGCGTIFEVDGSGQQSVIYRFKGQPDGEFPTGAMTHVGHALYGTTSGGGAACIAEFGCGTVFKITSTGVETLLYSFKGITVFHSFASTAPFRRTEDGSSPGAGLIYVDGKLYGTTEKGGTDDHGTVFAITTSGEESVVHHFAGAPADGADPKSTLINVSGTLYGTTSSGGAYDLGTVFAITTSGKVTILHSFRGPDGSGPSAGLLDVNGMLYGTTQHGSANQVGTVFAITASGAFRTLHCFFNDWDGAEPMGDLTDADGTIYGTASAGNAGGGYGSIFSVTPAGKLTVVHAFGPFPPSQRTSTSCAPRRG